MSEDLRLESSLVAAAVGLRPIVEADLAVLTGGDSPFDDWGPRPAPRPVPDADPSQAGALAVIDSQTGEVLGEVSWHYVQWGPNPESRNPMIGIWLKACARGRGVGSLAQRLLAEWLLDETAANRIEAHTDIENVAEQRALDRAGFTQEGIIRGAQWRRGAYHDGYLYSLLRGE